MSREEWRSDLYMFNALQAYNPTNRREVAENVLKVAKRRQYVVLYHRAIKDGVEVTTTPPHTRSALPSDSPTASPPDSPRDSQADSPPASQPGSPPDPQRDPPADIATPPGTPQPPSWAQPLVRPPGSNDPESKEIRVPRGISEILALEKDYDRHIVRRGKAIEKNWDFKYDQAFDDAVGDEHFVGLLPGVSLVA